MRHNQASQPELTVDDFPEFFKELWGYRPFPWQEDLVAEAAERQHFPALIDLPTGTGKTSVIDAFVFLQALDAMTDAYKRWVPRRLIVVVDRRVIVDQVADRALAIAEKLMDPGPGSEGSPLAVVAAHLRSLVDPHKYGTEEVEESTNDRDPPLLVASLRGGTTRDESWTRRPDVPAVISSTIDQAGSQLLFRGYGVSRRMWPVHAGLLGNDALWILDEVHLARPFAQTLAQLGELRNWRTGGENLPDRWGVVEMSATPTSSSRGSWTASASTVDHGWTFPEGALDTANSEVLQRRLAARKPARLEVVTVPANPIAADIRFAERCAREAKGLLKDGVRRLAVIVNRVDTARRVHQMLDTTHRGESGQPESGAITTLITGRMRPIDRDSKIKELESITTGARRSPEDKPIVVVSTQSIEAGADFDFDAIVTEAASLDSLRQRFGRVDRDGGVTEEGEPPTSVVLARGRSIAAGAEDPIYGPALAATWEWLSSLSEVDFGHGALPEPEPETLTKITPPSVPSPRLTPIHLDLLSHTSFPVHAEPEIARWLHGERPTETDVNIVWRADIDRGFLERLASLQAGQDQASKQELSEMVTRLTICPPSPLEMLPVPLSAARRWLSGLSSRSVADVPTAVTDEDVSDPHVDARPWIAWEDGGPRVVSSSSDHAREVSNRYSRELRPGMTIIVPSSYGGITAGTWDPESDTSVRDLATVALHRQRRLTVLRLHPRALNLANRVEADGDAVSTQWIPALPDATEWDEMTAKQRRDSVLELLNLEETLKQAGLSAEEVDRVPAAAWSRATVFNPPGAGFTDGASGRVSPIIVLRQFPQPARSILTGPTVDSGDDAEGSSFTGAGVKLDAHLFGVEAWARFFARGLGLSPPHVDHLGKAGRLHDLGKADPRFQLILHEGDPVAAAVSEPLAKSDVALRPLADRRRIRAASGYPTGARHELTSVALSRDTIRETSHPGLVTHLVVSHHGWCRPFAPSAADPHDVRVEYSLNDRILSTPSRHSLDRADSGLVDNFSALNREFGWFHLAWLESILRLADHRRSESEAIAAQEHKEKQPGGSGVVR